MKREIQDKDYIECLPPMYQRRYFAWRERMLCQLDTIVQAFEQASTPEEVMKALRLSPRDVALLVRLNYLTPEEAERFDLNRIECTVPA